MISFLSSQGALTRSVMVAHATAVACRTDAQQASAQADTAISGLSDQAREDAIKRAGDLMEKRYGDFARTGDLMDLGDAHAALLLMRKLIAGRSRDAVLRMEIRKGLI